MRRFVPGIVSVLFLTMAPVLGLGSIPSAGAAPRSPAVPTGIPPIAAGPVVVRGNTWFVRFSFSGGNADRQFVYGDRGDVPVMGDWDGDGDTTPGVFRRGVWYLSNQLGGVADQVVAFGNPTDVPIVGDWTGAGFDSIGIVRGTTWFLRSAAASGPFADIVFPYGDPGDLPVVGDWDSNGTVTAGIYRTASGPCACTLGTFLRDSNSSGPANHIGGGFHFGPGRPLGSDWGAGFPDWVGVVSPQGRWRAFQPVAGDIEFAYGNPGDVPLIYSGPIPA